MSKLMTAFALITKKEDKRGFQKAIADNITKTDMLQRMSDTAYLKLIYRLIFGRKLDLKNPQTFNEKLQWLKLNDRKTEYTTMVDKYEVKKYIAEKIGEEYVIPTLGVWDNFDDIDIDLLPNQFVLKCTHDSGGLVICKDKSKLDIAKAREKINKALTRRFYYFGREWPYKAVKPRIIAEKYMVDESVSELRDYKFFCFGGVCKCLKVDFDRFIEHRANYYDPQGNLLDLGEKICPPNKEKVIVLPDNKEKMLQLAEKLSTNIPFLRVDFYDVNGKIYFGELTFFPASGWGEFTDKKWDYKLGEWIKLPDSIGGCILLTREFVIRLQNKKENFALNDYKVFCFNGEPKVTLVCSERFSDGGLREDFFDEQWNHVPIKRPGHPNSNTAIPKPVNFEQMKSLAYRLSQNIPFLRVDFYEIDMKLYFGELTFYPASGFEEFEPDEWDYKFGEWIHLPGRK